MTALRSALEDLDLKRRKRFFAEHCVVARPDGSTLILDRAGNVVSASPARGERREELWP